MTGQQEETSDTNVSPCTVSEDNVIKLNDNAHALVLRYVEDADDGDRLSALIVNTCTSKDAIQGDIIILEVLSVLLYMVQHRPDIIADMQTEAAMEQPMGNA